MIVTKQLLQNELKINKQKKKEKNKENRDDALYPTNEYDKKKNDKKEKKCNTELNKCVGCELPSK